MKRRTVMNANIFKLSIALTTSALLNGSLVFAQGYLKYPDYPHWKTSVDGLFEYKTSEANRIAAEPKQTDSVIKPMRVDVQPGTTELQEHILSRINDGLVSDWLTPAQASEFKKRLNKINDNETWYRAQNDGIPASVLEADEKMLHELEAQIGPTKREGRNVVSVVQGIDHSAIDGLVAKALANHRISSEEAEKYYLRLAQLDSQSESLKHAQTEGSLLHSSLHDMQSELLKKLK